MPTEIDETFLERLNKMNIKKLFKGSFIFYVVGFFFLHNICSYCR